MPSRMAIPQRACFVEASYRRRRCLWTGRVRSRLREASPSFTKRCSLRSWRNAGDDCYGRRFPVAAEGSSMRRRRAEGKITDGQPTPAVARSASARPWPSWSSCKANIWAGSMHYPRTLRAVPWRKRYVRSAIEIYRSSDASRREFPHPSARVHAQRHRVAASLALRDPRLVARCWRNQGVPRETSSISARVQALCGVSQLTCARAQGLLRGIAPLSMTRLASSIAPPADENVIVFIPVSPMRACQPPFSLVATISWPRYRTACLSMAVSSSFR
jgi:hypothetical protein